MDERQLIGISQITLTDTTDARTLSLYLQPDKRKQVIYDPNTDTYNPDFSVDNLTLTPHLLVSDIDVEEARKNRINSAKEVTYSYRENSIGEWIEVTGTQPGFVIEGSSLKVISNVLRNFDTFLIQVEVIYEDENGIDIVSVTDIEMSKVTLGIHGEPGKPGEDGDPGKPGEDGVDGEDAVIALIQAPRGTTIYNREGYITLEFNIFKGANEVNPDFVRWYQVSPGSLGDEFSGRGWMYLGNNRKEIILDEGLIHDSNTILAIGQYGDNIYKLTQHVSDITDTLNVEILGPTEFRNGQGQVELYAKLYDNGVEIDRNGKQYGYSWYGYDNFGNLVNDFRRFGKHVTISADDVDNIVNVSLKTSENIATENTIGHLGSGVVGDGQRFTVNPVNQSNGVSISSGLFDRGLDYKIEFNLNELGGTITGLGGTLSGFELYKLRVNGKFYPLESWVSGGIDLTKEGIDNHFIELWAGCLSDMPVVSIQPGKGGYSSGSRVVLEEIGVMRDVPAPIEENYITWEEIQDNLWSDLEEQAWKDLTSGEGK